METDIEYVSTRHFDRDNWHKFLAERSAEPAQAEAAPAPTVDLDDPNAEALVTAEKFDEHGRAEFSRGRYDAARAMHERAMEIRRGICGEKDPKLTRSFTLLGNLSLTEERFEEAEWLYTQAYRTATKRFGDQHPMVAVALHNLGVLARRRGDLAGATKLYEHALAIKCEHFGEFHPSVAATLASLGNLARLQGDLHGSMEHYDRAREIYEATEGCISHGLASTLVGMGRVHLAYGLTESAVFLFERALRIREALIVSPTQLAACRFLLAMSLSDSWPVEARALFVTAIREYEVGFGVRSDCIEAMRRALHRLSGELALDPRHKN